MSRAILLFAILTSLFILPSHPADASDGGEAGRRKVLQEAKKELAANEYNGALAKLLDYISAEEKADRPDREALMDAYYCIGGVYSMYSNYAQSLDMYHKGYELSLLTGDGAMQFKFLNNMIGASCQTGDTRTAMKLNRKVRLTKGVAQGRKEFYYCFNMGFIFGQEGDHEGKIAWMRKAAETVGRYGLPGEMRIYPYSEMYQSYEKLGRLAEALDVLKRYDSIAHKMNRAYLYADCYKGLMRVYTKLGDKDKALHYQDEFFRYNDSLLNVNEFSQIKNRYQAGENRRTKQTIDSQQKTISLQKAVLAMLALTVIVAGCGMALVWAQRRKLHAANVALFERNRELVETERRLRESINRPKADPMQGDGEAQQARQQQQQWHEQLLARINDVMADEEVFCDPEFSMATLAKLAGSNTNYVSQAINSTYGKNFRTFVNEYRVRVAMRRLTDTDFYANYSVQGISESVGFKSVSNFIAAFKKTTGMTPSLYAKLSKGEMER